MHLRARRATRVTSTAIALTFLLASCGPAATPTPTATPPPRTPGAAPTATPTPAGPGGGLPAEVQAIVDRLGIPLFVPGPAEGVPKQGGSVRIRGLEPKSFDPHAYISYRLRITNSLSHERLMRFDAGPGKSPTTHTVVPSLAESWDIQDNGTTIVFHLRPGVRWHDKPPVNGREVKASDFVFTYDRALATEQATVQRNALSAVESYEAPDDRTLVFHLKKPSAPFLLQMARTGVEVLAPEVEKECGNFVTPECAATGTGPWMFKSFSPGSVAVYQRNPNWWDSGRPHIDEVQLLYFGDERAEDAAFRSGRLDLLGVETCGISGERYRALKSSNPEMLYPSFIDPFNRRAVWLRSDQPPFSDVRVRRAVSMAIDREGWVKSVLGNFGIPFGGYLYPGNPYYLPEEGYGEAAQYLRYDPDAAKRLLQDAGYKPGDIKVTLQSTTGYGERFASEAQLVAEAMNSIGIQTDISMVDYDSFIPVWRDGKWDHVVYTWTGFGFDPVDWMYVPFHSAQNGQRVLHINDPELDAVLDRMNAEYDPQLRVGLAQQAARRIMSQVYVIPGPPWLYFYAQNPRLKNYTYHDSFDIGYPLSFAWLE